MNLCNLNFSNQTVTHTRKILDCSQPTLHFKQAPPANPSLSLALKPPSIVSPSLNQTVSVATIKAPRSKITHKTQVPQNPPVQPHRSILHRNYKVAQPSTMPRPLRPTLQPVRKREPPVNTNSFECQKQAKLEKQRRIQETANKYNELSFQAKAKKGVTPLIQLTPSNLAQEKNKFFQSNFLYDPIFSYSVKNIRVGFKEPHTEYVQLARKIVMTYRQEYLKQFVWDQTYLTEQDITRRFKEYCAALGMEDQLALKFSTNLAVPACVQYSSPKSLVMIRQPVRYTAQHMTGVFHHEIGTHFVRKANHRLQPSHSETLQKDHQSYLTTEEGLAAVNQLTPLALGGESPPILFKAAITYLACYLSSTMSFQSLFAYLREFFQDDDRTWQQCVRVKRSVSNTASSQGFYKDQVYFIGALQILKNRHQIDFNQMHAVKLSLADFQILSRKKLIHTQDIYIPPFIHDMAQYHRALDIIAATNFVD